VTGARATTRRQIGAARCELVHLVGRLQRLDDDPTRRLLKVAPLAQPSALVWRDVESDLAWVWAAAVLVTDRLDHLDDLQLGRRRAARGWMAAAVRLLADTDVQARAAGATQQATTQGITAGAEPLGLHDLLTTMNELITRAQAVVAHADTTWSAVATSVTLAHRGLSESLTSARSSHVRVSVSATRAAEALQDALARVSEDPLLVNQPAVDALLADAAARQSEVAEATAQSRSFAKHHTRLLDSLEDTEAALAATCGRARQVALRVSVDACSERALRDLTRRLVCLRRDATSLSTVAHADWVATGRRIRAVQTGLDGLGRDIRDMDEVVAAALLEREVLRGRLSSYRARAARNGRAEDHDLQLKYEKAYDVLHQSPCDLSAAASLVHQYVESLEYAGLRR